MNAIGVAILFALLAEASLRWAADVLNLRSSRQDPPEVFRKALDPERYRRAQSYLDATTRFGWAESLFSLAAVLVFWFAGGFPLLDRWVRDLGWGPVATGTLFIGLLAAAKSAADLPFEWYRTFVIEERFGFNRTDGRTFLLDRLKGLALGLALGVPLLAGVLAFFVHAGPHAWWLSWAAVVAFMVGVQYVAPTWILPLFNRFEPLEEGGLRTAITAYARRIGFPLDNIFVMDGSRRSGKANAFFTGFGRRKRIVLFDTLVSRQTPAGLMAVLAHEMGHYQLKHIRQALVLGIAQTGVMFLLMSLVITHEGLFEAFYMERVSVHAGLVFFSLLYSPIAFFTGVGLLALSRRNEAAADRFAAETTGNPEALSDALVELSMANLANLTPHPLHVTLNHGHPPVADRIRALARAVPPEGRA